MLWLSLVIAGLLFIIGVAGVIADARKRDNFRAYWWGRLSAWAAANADASHQRKSRHAMYHAVWMSRADHKDGELEPWGAAAPPRSEFLWREKEGSAWVSK
jgi:hypothetical protein